MMLMGTVLAVKPAVSDIIKIDKLRYPEVGFRL